MVVEDSYAQRQGDGPGSSEDPEASSHPHKYLRTTIRTNTVMFLGGDFTVWEMLSIYIGISISSDNATHLQLNPKELSVKGSQSGRHHPHSGNL